MQGRSSTLAQSISLQVSRSSQYLGLVPCPQSRNPQVSPASRGAESRALMGKGMGGEESPGSTLAPGLWVGCTLLENSFWGRGGFCHQAKRKGA